MLVAFVLCVLFCVCALWSKRLRSRKLVHALPPAYPGALPIIGHAHLLFVDNDKLYEQTLNLAEESVRQGGVIVGFIGRDIYYIITDPDDALTAANSCLNFGYNFAKPWLGDGLITGSGEIWHRHRKLLTPSFSLPVVLGSLDIFNSQAKSMVSKDEANVGKGQFNLYDNLRFIFFETICLTAFGVGGVDKKFVRKYMETVDEILKILMKRFITFYLRNNFIYKLSGYQKKEAEGIRVLRDMSMKVLQKKKMAKENGADQGSNMTSGRYKPLLDLLLSMNGQVTDQEIREEVDTAIMAGFDTTSVALLYIFVMVGTYPDVQNKLYEEVITLLGPNRDVEKDDVNRLPYTEAVIKETLRYIAAAPSLVRSVDRDVKLKNFTMRAGSQCMLMPYGAHRHAVWGPDSREFRPERWLDASTMPNANAFGGFSWGKRNCVGKIYAMTAMKVTLAHYVRRYHIKADASKMKYKMDFILKPVSGHYISIERRI